jgi:hypothetical protein
MFSNLSKHKGFCRLCEGFVKVGYLERFRAKWIPVRVKKTRQNKMLEPGSDSIRTDKALWSRSRRTALAMTCSTVAQSGLRRAVHASRSFREYRNAVPDWSRQAGAGSGAWSLRWISPADH